MLAKRSARGECFSARSSATDRCLCRCCLCTAPCEQKYFTWDGHNFPHPLEMQAKLAAKSRELVTIVDPHMKRDPSWSVLQHSSHARGVVR